MEVIKSQNVIGAKTGISKRVNTEKKSQPIKSKGTIEKKKNRNVDTNAISKAFALMGNKLDASKITDPKNVMFITSCIR